MIVINIFGATIIDGFTFGIDSYDIYHHFPTPSLPLTIEIIISVNDDNDGWPLMHCSLVIDCIVKQGDNVFGRVRLSICVSAGDNVFSVLIYMDKMFLGVSIRHDRGMVTKKYD